MTWKQIMTVGSVMVGGFLYLIYKSQEKILYLNEQIPPKRTSENPSPYKNPGQHYMIYEDVWLTTSDGIKLHAWFIPAPRERNDRLAYSYSQSVIHKPDDITIDDPIIEENSNDDNNSNENRNNNNNNEESIISETSVPTLIWFHANAGNMGFRLPNLYKMHNELECNLFILSYRGYGESEGEPNEDGIKIDAETAMKYIFDRAQKRDARNTNHNNNNNNNNNNDSGDDRDDDDVDSNDDDDDDNDSDGEIDKNKIFVFGRSLGGAVATYISSKYDSKITGLILENTFLSISDMVGKVFPFLNFDIIKQYMLKIHWRTIDLIPNIECPILFLASEKDEIVPHNHMITLHNNAEKSSYTKMYKISDGMHNDAWLPEKGGTTYWRTMKEWMQEAIAIKEIELRKQQKQKEKEKEKRGGPAQDNQRLKSEL